MTLSEAYKTTVAALEPLYGEREAASVADLLFTDKYGADRVARVLGESEVFADQTVWQDDLERLSRWEPVQYVVGFAEFAGRRFEVTPDTLIPRVETEQLVKEILQRYAHTEKPRKVLDIGTGSGAIAISLALEWPQAEVTAWDISAGALETARRNAHKLGAPVRFQQRDVLDTAADERFDLVVSNPPYVLESDRAAMRDNVVRYEPEGALYVPDADPLRFYRAIVALDFGERELWFEIHERFGVETRQLLEQHGFTAVEILPDIHGRDRIVRGITG